MNKSFLLTIIVIITIAALMLLSRGSFFAPYAETIMKEHTFAMIKPDAVAAKNSGKIISMIEDNGFTILRMQKTQLTKEKAEQFYAVHKTRPFFGELVSFVTSGPVIIMALEKENAIKSWRDLMGATDPAKAEAGTVRKLYGTSIGTNATHGSDAPETAREELALFFPDLK
jgi:nucleoside-diphosphate kinase